MLDRGCGYRCKSEGDTVIESRQRGIGYGNKLCGNGRIGTYGARAPSRTRNIISLRPHVRTKQFLSAFHVYLWRYLHLPYILTHIVQLVKRMSGKRLFMVVMMTMVMVVMVTSLDERFVMMILLAREPRAQRKDWPESVGEDHVCY